MCCSFHHIKLSKRTLLASDARTLSDRRSLVLTSLHRGSGLAVLRIATKRRNTKLQLLGQAARNMVLQEDAILHSEDSLRKMAIITTHLQYQQEAIQKNVELSSNLQDQLKHLLK
ncbi:BLOC-1-related complex subunit 7 isoform X2 [Macrotis lagotis]|uniref:BLOC-1-related complex subunit 7 isoform X2 n=1 Tax=Macrotis lagotis TaxID=92651 RepID=UPI003D684D6E